MTSFAFKISFFAPNVLSQLFLWSFLPATLEKQDFLLS